MAKPVIIAIDDQPITCEMIKGNLENDYDIKTFTSGNDAIKFVNESHVDLVLLDYEMPVVTGYGVLMAIRSKKQTMDIPVIFITSVTNKRLEEEMMARGANAFITKPIDFLLLRRLIQEHLTGKAT